MQARYRGGETQILGVINIQDGPVWVTRSGTCTTNFAVFSTGETGSGRFARGREHGALAERGPCAGAGVEEFSPPFAGVGGHSNG